MDARDLDMLGMNLAEVGTEPTNIVKNCNDKSSGSDDYSYKSAEIGTDCISRKAAIDDAHRQIWYRMNPSMKDRIDEWLEALPSAQPEKLTDIEQRIFLAAMGREEKVCRQVDKEPSNADCINLMRVCKSIERKVKGALWT